MTLLGERIGLRLAKLGMSQAELARRVGLTQPTINGLVTGKSASSAHIHRIARELLTTVAYLTAETDDPGSDQPDDLLSSLDRNDLHLLRSLSRLDRDAIRQLMKSLAGQTLTPTPDAVLSPMHKATPAPTTLHSPARPFSSQDERRGKAA